MSSHTPHPAEAGPRKGGFPHLYTVLVEGVPGGGLISAGTRPDIHGGLPPQFGGTDTQWSPEHMLLGATGLCLEATFQALARSRSLDVRRYLSRVEGKLDSTPGGIAFSTIAIHVDITVAGADVLAAEEVLLEAKKHCIVARSLTVPVELMATVHA